MDYKKKYEEALERARKLKENPQMVFYEYSPEEGDTICDYIFPELKESEDERIKESIIATIHLYYGEPLEDEAKEMLAWLEKQGEKKSQRMISAEAKEAMYDKPAWSEENEVRINRIVACLENLNVADNDILLKDVNWLKSLKQRIGG